MIIYSYDKTFEGLLTVVFDAYARKTFPDALVAEGEPLPLFYTECIHSYTDGEKSTRVWQGLQKKIAASALSCLMAGWLSEQWAVDMLIFQYIRKALDTPHSIELNFGDPDVLELFKLAKKVDQERSRLIQFLRFQKAADGLFFAVVEPQYNVLSLAIEHFKDRFADQKWLIYDVKRKYGYYYDLFTVTEVSFAPEEALLLSTWLREELLAKDEKLFQQLWQTYFKSISIKERLNPKLHRQNMPARFWKYLTEKKLS